MLFIYTQYLSDSSVSALHVFSCLNFTLHQEGNLFVVLILKKKLKLREGKALTLSHQADRNDSEGQTVGGGHKWTHPLHCPNKSLHFKTFNNIFYITLYIQNIIILTCNQIKITNMILYIFLLAGPPNMINSKPAAHSKHWIAPCASGCLFT